MDIIRAFADGALRVAKAPVIWVGVYVLTALLTLPLVFTLCASIEADLGSSLVAEQMADGVSYDWWQEFDARTDSLGRTFRPTIIGFAASLDNLSRLIDHGPRPVALVGLVAAYLGMWAFLVGGIVDRYARQRPTRAEGFFPACGVYFVRFIRLAIVSALVYYVLFGVVHGWLLGDLYGRLTHDLTVERTGFFIRLSLYGVFGLLLTLANMVLDYAKIRTVVEDRRSMIGAVLAGLRFVVRHPLRTLGLYALNGLAFILVLAAYAVTAPGVVPAGPALWGALLVGQAYLVARLGLKLLFYASQTAFFQQQLAHAAYAALPPPVWPESPSAEAIGHAEP